MSSAPCHPHGSLTWYLWLFSLCSRLRATLGGKGTPGGSSASFGVLLGLVFSSVLMCLCAHTAHRLLNSHYEHAAGITLDTFLSVSVFLARSLPTYPHAIWLLFSTELHIICLNKTRNHIYKVSVFVSEGICMNYKENKITKKEFQTSSSFTYLYFVNDPSSLSRQVSSLRNFFWGQEQSSPLDVETTAPESTEWQAPWLKPLCINEGTWHMKLRKWPYTMYHPLRCTCRHPSAVHQTLGTKWRTVVCEKRGFSSLFLFLLDC